MSTVEALIPGTPGLLLVTFVAGDAFTSDDGTVATLDIVSVTMKPWLDKFCPGWKSKENVMAVALFPGDALAVGAGTGTLVPEPHAYGGAALSTDDDAYTYNSVINLSTTAAPAVKMFLIGGAESTTLDAARAHRALVYVGPRIMPDTLGDVFPNLPQTFTSNMITA